MTSLTRHALSCATHNILDPKLALKWATKAGLNTLGKQTKKAALRAAAATETKWQQYSNWNERCPLIASNLQQAKIICLQEVSPTTLDDLVTTSNGYQVAHSCYHSSLIGNAILYKAEDVKCLGGYSVTHTMSSGKERRAAVALFELNERIIKVASLHLMGYPSWLPSSPPKEEGLLEWRSYLKGIEKKSGNVDGIIIAGDFNETMPEKGARLTLLQQRGYHLASLKKRRRSSKKQVDWIAYRAFSKQGHAHIVPTHNSSLKRTSDHPMIQATVTWS